MEINDRDTFGCSSQDHLMTSITFNDMAKEVVDLYKRLGNE